MIYYLYHIPGKKIGVTTNPSIRISKQQGYKPGEYEIIEVSGDIDYISERELTLQKQMGYKVDLNKYSETVKNKKSMNINVTEQTTTFPCSVRELPARLMDNEDFIWETNYGSFELNQKSINWIMNNVQTSQFNIDRCFIYNKAFSVAMSLDKIHGKNIDNSVFDNIRQWAGDRGIYEKGNAHTQYVKLQEEAGELAKALLQNDKPEVIDAIGDIVVVLTNLAHLKGLRIEDCINSAYSVISKRTGKMVNGTFVKDKL